MSKMVDENWYSVNESLPDIGKRVRVICVKELVYIGNSNGKTAEWRDDGKGEHGIYSWSPRLNNKANRLIS